MVDDTQHALILDKKESELMYEALIDFRNPIPAGRKFREVSTLLTKLEKYIENF